MWINWSEFSPLEEVLREFEARGWAKCVQDRWSFTSSGFLLSNILIGALLEAQAAYKRSGSPWVTAVEETALSMPDAAGPSVK